MNIMITKKTYSEVYAVLNLLSWNFLNKIPDNILEKIENRRDKQQEIVIDNIKEYKLSDQTNKILALLYKNYFASDYEKKIIQAKEIIMKNKKSY